MFTEQNSLEYIWISNLLVHPPGMLLISHSASSTADSDGNEPKPTAYTRGSLSVFSSTRVFIPTWKLSLFCLSCRVLKRWCCRYLRCQVTNRRDNGYICVFECLDVYVVMISMASCKKRRNSSALALELRLFCIKPSIWVIACVYSFYIYIYMYHTNVTWVPISPATQYFSSKNIFPEQWI